MDIEKKIQKNIFLKNYTTFGIGGPARYFLEVTTLEEVKQALKLSKKEGLPFVVIGKGSNTLFQDQGYNGLVILNKIHFIEWEESYVKVGAGYSFSLLGVQSARKGFAGLEFASGIPGTVGGAVFMNAGANKQEVRDTLYEVGFVDQEGEYKIYSREEITFAYRKSSFQSLKGCIVHATFCLQKSEEARAKQLEIVDYRTKTQPYGEKSAGCVFVNPKDKSAGAIIDALGLKGKKIGGACVSKVHANFIINEQNATAQDILELASLVREEVFKQTGEMLEMEVVKIPYDGEV